MSNNFFIGQKVVHIKEFKEVDPNSVFAKMVRLEVGAVYTVRGIVGPERSFNKDEPGLYLAEVINPIGFDIELAYGAFSFKPAIDRSTDTGMAILNKILDEYKQPAKV